MTRRSSRGSLQELEKDAEIGEFCKKFLEFLGWKQTQEKNEKTTYLRLYAMHAGLKTPKADDLPAEELAEIPTVCGSLREALDSLSADRGFLTQGGVFTDDQIDAYIELKMEEVIALEHTPHPVEFQMYYSA